MFPGQVCPRLMDIGAPPPPPIRPRPPTLAKDLGKIFHEMCLTDCTFETMDREVRHPYIRNRIRTRIRNRNHLRYRTWGGVQVSQDCDQSLFHPLPGGNLQAPPPYTDPYTDPYTGPYPTLKPDGRRPPRPFIWRRRGSCPACPPRSIHSV